MTIRRAAECLLYVVLISVLGALNCSAQSGVPAQITEPHGDQPFGSYHVSDIDSIAYANGALDIHLPLFAHSGRGLAHQKIFTYTNKSWFPFSQPPCDPTLTECPPPDPPFWMPAQTNVGISSSRRYINNCGTGHQKQEDSDYTYVDEMGTPHVFDAVTTAITPVQTNCIHVKTVGYALDGSGMKIDVSDQSHPIVILKDGTRITTDASGGTPFVKKDSNGNSLTEDGNISSGVVLNEVDTLGRTIQHLHGTLPDGAQYEDWITQDMQGHDQRARIEYVSVPVCTNFRYEDYIEFCGSLRLARKIDLPDGLAYQFTYDSGTTPGHYGELLRIDLPSGGYIRYEYGPTPSTSSTLDVLRGVVLRAVSVDGTAASEKIWRYSYPPPTFNGLWVEIDPDGNQITRRFIIPGFNSTPIETEAKYYQGSAASGLLLKTVITDYENLTLNVGDGNDVYQTSHTLSRPIHVTTTLDNGLVSKVETVYDPLPDNNGLISYSRSNVTERREYDFGQGAPGALLRRTDYSYWHNSFAAYADANIVDLVQNVTVYDGAGTVVAQTQNVYDGGSIASSTGQVTGHDTNFGPGYTLRGNLTLVKHWRNTDNTWLTTTFAYNDLGNLISATDPGNHTTNYSFSDSWSGASCTPANWNTFAFLTEVSNALSQLTHASYFSCPGLIQSKRDANDILANRPGSTFTYDFMNRLLTATTVENATTTFDYHTSNGVDTLPLKITATTPATPNPSIAKSTVYDGLGRTVQTSLDSDVPSPDFVDTTYDNLGRTFTVTNPYRTGGSSTDGVTTTYYDALGRVVQVAPQDGTLVPAGANVTQCLANNACTSYSGNSVTSTDEAGHQRRTRTDALGRLVEVDEPGTPSAFVANNYANLAMDGNFAVFGPANDVKWQTNTHGATNTVYGLNVQDDGNVVKYTPTWGSPLPTTTGTATLSSWGCIGSKIFTNQTLASGQCLQSTNNRFILLMQTPGNLVLYDASYSPAVPIFYSGTTSVPGSHAIMQSDGNLVVYTPSNTVYWSTGTVTGTANYLLQLQDQGNLVIYKDIWETGTVQPPNSGALNGVACTNMGGSIVMGQSIQMGSCLMSPSGRFALDMQTDGNLVLYDRTSNPARALWSTGTWLTPLDPIVAMKTLYFYDTLGNLYCVEQHGTAATGTGCPSTPASPTTPVAPDPTNPWRRRMFGYDSLSRLLWASNPESGVITYSYDADGNLLQKTSPAPNQQGSATQTISYCYDALHRVTGKGYGAQSCPLSSPVVSYLYDQGTEGKGKLTHVADQGGTADYTYDQMGRLKTETRVIGGVSKSMSYDYNLDSSVGAIHYPSGAVVSYSANGAGRTIYAKDVTNGLSYADSATFSPDGQMTSFISGSGTGAGITSSFSYNKRLQPINMSASTPSQTVFSIGYDFHLGNGNNGNVYNIYNYRDRNRDQSFSYDALNRLTSAQNAGTNCAAGTLNGKTEYWGNNYAYDAWGNLTTKSITKCSAENMSLAVAASNRISTAGYGYDSAGNMTADPTEGGITLTYDPENRITGAAGYAYTYDADGNRVKKSNGSTTTLYWYMTPGIVGESDLAGTMKSEYVFFNGERVARRDNPGTPTATVAYYFSDHLKTASVITDSAGVVKADSDYYPWGGELQFVNADSNHYKFTGKERDTETNLDYFGARYYSNGMGRFITPDWAEKATAVPYASFGNPQTLNLYAYVGNNPVNRVDLDGHISHEFDQLNASPEGEGGSSSTSSARLLAAMELFSSNTVSQIQNAVAAKQIASVARNKVNKTDYLVNKAKGSYSAGTDKCNELVADTIEEAGLSRPRVHYTNTGGLKGWFRSFFTRDPDANEWANPQIKISGWSSPKPLSEARAGDVIAQQHGQWGHSGIVFAPGQTVSVNTAATPAGIVTINNWGFRPAPLNGEGPNDPPPVVRHYLGGVE